MSEEGTDDIIRRLQELHLEKEELHEEEKELLSRLRSKSEQEEESDNRAEGFAVGDHVYITNKVSHLPPLRRATPADRAAIVDNITRTRVYLITYRGHHTWRQPGNIRALTPREQRNIRKNHF